METLIAVMLATFVIGIGTSLIFSCLRVRENAKVYFEKMMYRHMLQSRLRSILQNMTCHKSSLPLLLTPQGPENNPSLLFFADFKAFYLPQLANDSLCYLFLGKEGLKLALHADPARKKMNQTSEAVFLLWPHAKRVTWNFLGKENLSSQTLDWTDTWEDPKELPLAIRLTVEEQEGSKYTFTTIIEERAIKRIPVSLNLTYSQLQTYLPQDAEEEEK